MKTIRVGAIDYELRAVKGLKDEKGEDLCGQQGYAEAVIEVSSGMAALPTFATIWHEVLHAVECQHGWAEDEERVSALADSIVQILRDNPEMRTPPA